MCDFDFVKCSKNGIFAPTVEHNFKFDYDQVKKLAGQGKIYTRLRNFSSKNDEDDDNDLPPVLRNFQQVRNPFIIFTPSNRPFRNCCRHIVLWAKYGCLGDQNPAKKQLK